MADQNAESAVRWTVGDELSAEQVEELVAKLRQPAPNKLDSELAHERRWEELNLWHKS